MAPFEPQRPESGAIALPTSRPIPTLNNGVGTYYGHMEESWACLLHGPQGSSGVSGSHLSWDESRRPARIDFPGRFGPEVLLGNSGRSLRQDEMAGACSREGGCLGEEEFKKELLAQMSEGLKAHHFGEERG